MTEHVCLANHRSFDDLRSFEFDGVLIDFKHQQRAVATARSEGYFEIRTEWSAALYRHNDEIYLQIDNLRFPLDTETHLELTDEGAVRSFRVLRRGTDVLRLDYPFQEWRIPGDIISVGVEGEHFDLLLYATNVTSDVSRRESFRVGEPRPN